ncbi:MAG: peptide ABC transporter permease [Firmicutes bacterium ZCTH02-B6]|nr:MAG: peptide ABC transporter permease [Firmicutes bacterium ZCTH02-B6]
MQVLKRLLRHRSARVGGLLLIFITLMAIFAGVIAPNGYDDQDLLSRLKPPSKEHWMGTDQLGRGIFDRVVWGARISLMVGIAATAISLVLGTALGLVSGYYGGWVDRVIMGVMEVLLAFPGILLAIAVVSIFGPGLNNVMLAVGIAHVPQFARMARGATLSAKAMDFVEAERAIGANHSRIIWVHILPNILGPIVVLSTLSVGTSILSAAGLSFLGLGAQPPVPDWGGMISQGRQFLRTAWWVGVFPGLAILITVLGFNLLGDGLRDALDPRMRLNKNQG